MNQRSQREWSLDAARATLLVLGIVLHTGNIYAVGSGWLVKDSESNAAFNWLVAFIHIFRVPGFFWLSGFFCGLTYAKVGFVRTLKDRYLRLGVPLLFTWVVINRVQEFVMAGGDWTALTPWGQLTPLYHLWFLVDLAVMLPSIGLVKVAFDGMLFSAVFRYLGAVHWFFLMLFLTVFSMGISLLVRVSGLGYFDLMGLTTLFRLANGLPYFIAGFLMFNLPSLRQKYYSVPIPAIIFAAILGPMLEVLLPRLNGMEGELKNSANILIVWVLIAAVLRLCQVLFRNGSRSLGLVVAASYSIYLLHHVCVIALGLAVMHLGLPAWIKFLFVCTFTFSLTVLAHHFLIARIGALRFLLNGRMK
ncbi:acyltransferase family protein [Niveibacterium sp. 24ML]|uniref:acyltransferase family protein n=1 Tax=Niveibacterium sp. 24ML TaxID=2985512 RepID=UPI00226FF40D|nr:acyltransferase family protein [Niveibacterium sp. 24ML]MCX9156855.1 acyltransferase family protein [Niveibacterium sp. 24ML]